MQRPHSRFSLPTSSSTGILQRTFGAMPVGAADVNGLTSLKRQRSNDAPLRERRPIHQRNPIMRKAGQPPPFARIGATTNRNRLGAAIPPQEALLAYSPPAPGADEDGNWWLYTSRILTCCICAPCLVGMGKKDIHVQQAWREKVALCIIIASIMSAVAFLSFGLQASLCPDSRGSLVSDAVLNQSDHLTLNYRNNVVIYGYIYDFGEVRDRLSGRGNIQLTSDWLGRDITSLFQPAVDACAGISTIPTPKCFVENRFPGSPSLEPNPGEPCPSYSWLEGLKPAGRAFFTWQDLSMNKEPPHTLVAFNGAVLNLTSFFRSSRDSFNPSSVAAVERVVGTDGTRGLSFSPATLAFVNCLKNRHIVGYLDKESIGCVATQAIQSVCLAVILCVIMTRFLMAITFHWFISERLTKIRGNKRHYPQSTPQVALPLDRQTDPSVRLSQASFIALGQNIRPKAKVDDPYVIMLVTCYSEGEEGIRNTLESLASTDYPDTHKLLFVIADGLITGYGNSMSTPDAIISMISQDESLPGPDSKSYHAISDGAKQHNMAKVYSGSYIHNCGGSVPIIGIIKCGTPEEQNSPGQKKAGNRGKRDSQLILMNFLSRVMFNDRMTPLDYELFSKIQMITGVNPDVYTLVLMVDADTKVAPDSLKYMVQAMKNDPTIMGLCGETRIANKRTSWVTAIQVFEYYISHHLGKAFESVFGGVTCLPGCFCMYRVKAPKGPQGTFVVPILANPDIVDEYSENIVDTLHKKNLLLLGEDRFLTTLMLRTFPKRKMIFVPQAICRTVVPDTFKMLLSQRRRWINSTIHNLLELVLLRDLCGIFCFSMQFIVMLELIGTVVLPAAITFVFVLLFSAMVSGKVATLPLLMLLATLGLPGVLIVITTRKVVYLVWMVVYILALPVWNFVLPIYAFWHFDDFTWGETRKVEGEAEQHDHSTRTGQYEIGAVVLKTWAQWESEKRNGMRAQGNASIRHRSSRTFIAAAADTVEQVAESIQYELVPQSRTIHQSRVSLSGPSGVSNWLTSTISSPTVEPKESIPLQTIFNKTSWGEEPKPVTMVNVGEFTHLAIPKQPERNGFTVSSAIGNWLTSSISPAAEPKETVPLQSLFKKTSWTDETKSVPAVFVGDGNTVTISKLPDRSISKISIAASRYPSESQGNVAQGSVSSASNLYTAASQLESNISRKIIRKKPVPLETNVNTADSAMGGFLMCSTPNMSAQLESSFDLFSKTIGEVELLDECASLDSRRSSRLERGSDVSSRPSVKSLARAEPLAADEYVDAYTKSIDPEWDVIEVLPRNDGGQQGQTFAGNQVGVSLDLSSISRIDGSTRKKAFGPRPMPF